MICTLIAPIGIRLQSFQPGGALSRFGKTEINAPINAIIIHNVQPAKRRGSSIRLGRRQYVLISKQSVLLPQVKMNSLIHCQGHS